MWGVRALKPLQSHTGPGDDRSVILTDSARFAVDDVDPLVMATFACPYCLELPSSTLFNLEEPHGSAVLCRCDACHTSWVVAVAGGKAQPAAHGVDYRRRGGRPCGIRVE